MSGPGSSEKIREQLLARPDLIPSLPDIVQRSLDLIGDPEAEASDFERLLSRDPPLVANVLRIANSPLYGFVHKKETIRDAIIGMGIKGLRGVLLCSTMKRFLGPQFACYGKDPKALWRHAVAVAAGARIMAKGLRSAGEDPEEMFVAGLLHDLGKLLLAPHLTRMGVDLTESDEPAHEVELRLLGITHMEAGGIMAEKWNLGPLMRSVIRHHHGGDAPAEHRHAVAIVRLADQVATADGMSAGALSGDLTRFAEDLAIVRLQPAEWEAARKAVSGAVAKALAQME